MTAQTVQHQKIVLNSALIVDQQRLQSAAAKIHKLTRSGCIIEAYSVGEFSDRIGLRFDGVDQMISGRIDWRKDRVAGVTFEWHTQAQSDNRQEHRINVKIPAIVCNRERTLQTNGVIRDASRSGCRIEVEDPEELCDDILIKIEAIDWLVKGTIVWRDGNDLGVRLLWDFAEEMPEQMRQCSA